MLITVLLSVFNGEEWIDECIRSILNQTFEDFEFLIINDGSTDNSLNIINRYAIFDSRIRVISQENIGLTESLNKGLNLSIGKWIARIDCDDISLPDRLKLQLKFAEKYKMNLIGCQSKIINENGEIINTYTLPCSSEKLISNLVKQRVFFSHSSAFFNKDIAKKIGGYRRAMKKSQDYDLWLRFSETKKIGCISYTGIYIRQHDKRISFLDYGIEQRLLAHCAKISYLIRVNYNSDIDPLSSDNSNKDLSKFKRFVYEKLENYGYIKFYRQLNKYHNKKRIYNFLFSYFFIIRYFYTPRLMFILLKKIIKGDTISSNIFKEYIKNHNF